MTPPTALPDGLPTEPKTGPVTPSRRACLLPGCGRPHLARGYCRAHYLRWQRHGTPLPDVPVVDRRYDTITYRAAHAQVRADRGPASAHRCTQCGQPAVMWCYDGTDPVAGTDRRGRRFRPRLSPLPASLPVLPPPSRPVPNAASDATSTARGPNGSTAPAPPPAASPPYCASARARSSPRSATATSRSAPPAEPADQTSPDTSTTSPPNTRTPITRPPITPTRTSKQQPDTQDHHQQQERNYSTTQERQPDHCIAIPR